MTVHLGREFGRIDKEVHRRNDFASEPVVWYEFLDFVNPNGSTYDDVYDEGPIGAGGKKYTQGVTVESIYVEEIEDESRAIETGRQPTQNVSITFRMTDMERAGITNPGEYNAHLNDLFRYDARYYKVYKYKARGRMDGEEVLVAVEGVEILLDQDMVLDDDIIEPTQHSWPNSLPNLV